MTHVVLVRSDRSSRTASATVVPWNAIVIYPVPPAARPTHRQHRRLARVRLHARVRAHPAPRSIARLGTAGARVVRPQRDRVSQSHAAVVADRRAGHADRKRGRRRTAARGRLPRGRGHGCARRPARAARSRRMGGWSTGHRARAGTPTAHDSTSTCSRPTAPNSSASCPIEPRAGCPFLTSGAFRSVYGKLAGPVVAGLSVRRFSARLGRRRIRRRLRSRASDSSSMARARRRMARSISRPPIAHRFPGIYRMTPGAAAADRVVSRYGGDHFSVTARDVLFDQLEVVRGAALVSDLYLHEFCDRPHASADPARRLSEADRSPDGTRIAAVQVDRRRTTARRPGRDGVARRVAPDRGAGPRRCWRATRAATSSTRRRAGRRTAARLPRSGACAAARRRWCSSMATTLREVGDRSRRRAAGASSTRRSVRWLDAVCRRKRGR